MRDLRSWIIVLPLALLCFAGSTFAARAAAGNTGSFAEHLLTLVFFCLSWFVLALVWKAVKALLKK